MGTGGEHKAIEELDRAHGRFDISLHLYMTWLGEAYARRDRAKGFDKAKLQGTVVLAEKAAAVFAVSAFEGFIRAAVAMGREASKGLEVHGLADLEVMLREAWGLELGRIVMKRGEYLDLLLAWRWDIVHGGDVPSQEFLRRFEAIYGPKVAASWTPEVPQFPGPGGVTALLSNLAECEFLIHNEVRAKLRATEGA